ncbi:MAG: hypothetical protein HC822_08015 [Oscillochloris sp.]|nr:hypothetical protein [Oscillochloris sp.]
MQLRLYLAIARRFWLLLLLLPLIAGAASFAVAMNRAEQYGASARIMVSQAPLDSATTAELPDYNNSYSWLTSEYILDDLPQVVTSAAFAEDVRAAAAAAGYDLALPAIQSALRAEVLHRSVVITAVAAGPDQALAIVRGAISALETYGLKYWNRAPASGGGLRVAVLDPPGGGAPVGSLRDLVIDVGLRVTLALAAAIGIALLLHYLDDRLRNARQAEQWTGAQVLAVIPKEK